MRLEVEVKETGRDGPQGPRGFGGAFGVASHRFTGLLFRNLYEVTIARTHRKQYGFLTMATSSKSLNENPVADVVACPYKLVHVAVCSRDSRSKDKARKHG